MAILNNLLDKETPEDTIKKALQDWMYKFPLLGVNNITRPMGVSKEGEVMYETLPDTYYDGYSQVLYNLPDSSNSQLYITQKYLIVFITKGRNGIGAMISLHSQKLVKIYKLVEDDGVFYISAKETNLPEEWKPRLTSEIAELKDLRVDNQRIIENIFKL